MFTTQEHWQFFHEFCKLEIASGGPDPQISLAAQMSKGSPFAEMVWRAGCYISVYNVPYGEVLWREWPWERVCTERKALKPWLESNWPKITTRIERRCVRRPEWMLQFLLGYADLAKTMPALRSRANSLDPVDAYELLWEKANTVPRLGRYVALKLLEFYKRYCGFKLEAPDIRPRGGWSPRSTLATLWDDDRVGDKGDRPEVLVLVNQRCQETIARLDNEFGLKIDLFQLQVALCEYRESWESRRQYPGRSLDSELKYVRKAEAEWGVKSAIWKARKAFYPHEHLGELNGWEGPREECANSLATKGFTWSDLLYDYKATHDFSRPVTREGVPDPVVKPALIKAKKAHKTKSALTVYPMLEGRLYQSSRWSVLSVEDGLKLAKDHGITGLANFWKHSPNIPQMVQDYWWHPLADGKRIPPLGQIVDKLEKYIRGGGVLLSMCYGGRNRSGLITALLIQRLTGCTGQEAAIRVKLVRKGALVNQYFLDYLYSINKPGDMKRGLLL